MIAAIGPLLALALGGPPDDPPLPLAARYAAIGLEAAVRSERFDIELHKAGQDMAKVEPANDRHWADMKRLRDRTVDLIKANTADPANFPGILLLAGPLGYPLDQDIQFLVYKYHLDDPQLGRLCFDLRQRWTRNEREWVRNLLQRALLSPHRDVRGRAAYCLGDNYRMEALPREDPPAEAAQAPLLAEAKRYFEIVTHEYADVTTPDGHHPLGPKAIGELARIRNLPDLKVGRPAPEIVGPDLDGTTRRLSDYRGQVVVLVFWQQWEGRRGTTMLYSRDLLNVVRGLPCTVLGVGYDEFGVEWARATVAREKIPGPIWWDAENRGPIQSAYNIRGWPAAFLIDRKGIIRHIGPEYAEFAPFVDALAAEPK